MEDDSVDAKTGLLWMGESNRTGTAWIRDGWEQAKKENRLTGCGLMGSMTMDDIEDMEVKVKDAMTTWSRLAGTFKPGFSPEDKKDVSLAINKLSEDIAKLAKEVSELRKNLDLEVALRDMAKELKNAK